MSLDLWNFILGPALGAVITLCGAAIYVWRKINKKVKALAPFTDPRFAHFLDDWFGEEERPGVAARPGTMARLRCIEDRLSTVEGDTKQLQRNGGSHMRDAIDRLEAALKRLPGGGDQP